MAHTDQLDLRVYLSRLATVHHKAAQSGADADYCSTGARGGSWGNHSVILATAYDDLAQRKDLVETAKRWSELPCCPSAGLDKDEQIRAALDRARSAAGQAALAFLASRPG